jgi:ATP-dependent Clp protease ATP-binding subunit ClpB
MLSDRYITDKFLPDKAIDLIDEAAAKVKTEMHSLPVELDKIYRQIIHKETERASLLNETDSASKQKMEEINNELIELKKTKASEEEI